MDTRKLILILRGTIDPAQRKEAEAQLNQIHKIIGFTPILLQVIMQDDAEFAVRQAGAVYLKNLITHSWIEQEAEVGSPIPFNIHEQDRGMIRDEIVEAVIRAPELIRSQLIVCVNTIVRSDFPGRWTQIVDKISVYLQTPEFEKLHGALLCLYQLVKNFEYKKSEERAPLNDAMRLLLPMIYDLMIRLLPDNSEKSVLLQKDILKIYFSLIQYTLSFDLITKEVFSQWMEVTKQVTDRDVPDKIGANGDEEQQPWWKCKKWALHILYRVFERYGSPGNVSKDYKEFANWYLTTFSSGIIDTLLKLLNRQGRREFVAPRVLRLALSYLNQAISHAYTWSLLKLHMFDIIEKIIYPLMCHTEDDEELWKSDPMEYIRSKFDTYDELWSHITAAQSLLHSACQKRKQMLPKTVHFAVQVLQNPASTPAQKDGVLYILGSVADILFKKGMYKNDMERMLLTYVFPEFNSPFGYLRSRACWTLCHFAEANFEDENILRDGTNLLLNSLITDSELRVKVEAAISLLTLLTSQERSHKYIEMRVKEVTLQILSLIRETKNDDLTNVLQRIICVHQTEITSFAKEICQHLACTFMEMVEETTRTIDDENSMTAMSILNTMETLLNALEDHTQIISELRPILIRIVALIFTDNIMDFYEEALNIVYELTCKEIAPEMWHVLEMIYQVFQTDGADYFMDMMPTLHNYITVDTDAFLSNENHVLAIFEMCKTVLTMELGEEPECHAAKLLEVVILQCKGRIDQCIPTFVSVALQRLAKGVKTSELRIMCLQVVIAALYYNAPLLLDTLNKLQTEMLQTESITSHFIKQWLHDADCFLGLHDRKICVLGLCMLMVVEPQRPVVLNEYAQQIIPSLILLFQGLKRAYASRAQEDASDSDDEEEESDYENVLSSDEDETAEEYLDSMKSVVEKKSASSPFSITASIQEDDDEDDTDSDSDYDSPEETPLENYTTPLDDENNEIDEYMYFKNVLLALKERDPTFYAALTSHLNEEQHKQLNEIVLLAEQRRAAAESKKIEESGGYVFIQQSVPQTFNFGGTPLGQ